MTFRLSSIPGLCSVGLLLFSAFASAENTAATPVPPSLPDAPSAVVAMRNSEAGLSGTVYSTSTPPDDPNHSAASTDGTEDEATSDGSLASDGLPGWLTGRSVGKRLLKPRVKFVGVGQVATPQRAHDKVMLGLRESVTPFGIAGWFFSAGWSQLINSSPNYGTDRGAFGQRLGAAAALNTSKEIFADSFFAPLLHQDPRYYQLGPRHRFSTRVIYAATRPIIGRTDGGRTIPNFAFVLGTGAASALTHTYYPERNVRPRQVGLTWGTSLGGSAVGYLFSEFGGEIVQWLHIAKFE